MNEQKNFKRVSVNLKNFKFTRTVKLFNFSYHLLSIVTHMDLLTFKYELTALYGYFIIKKERVFTIGERR